MPRKLACDFPLADGSPCGGCDRCFKREYARERYRWPGVAEERRQEVLGWQDENRDEMLARRRANPWKEPDPKKELARRLARAIPKLPCQWLLEDGTECGVEPTERHHPDYDKPMDVVHLCKEHHGLTHRKV